MVWDAVQEHVWKWVDGELRNFLKIPFGIRKKQDKYYARILRKHASVAVLQEQTPAPLNKARLFYGSFSDIHPH